MKKIFIGACSGVNDYISSYYSTIVYQFFNLNGYTIVKRAKHSDFILLNGFPFNKFLEINDILTIGYYLKKYPDKKIILFGNLPEMLPKNIPLVINIELGKFYKFDDLFTHKISINDINIDKIRFFLPLNNYELYLKDFGHNITIKSTYKYKQKDFLIKVDDLINGNYDIDGLKEYDEKYCYLENNTLDYFITTSIGCPFNCYYCVIKNINNGAFKSFDKNLIIEKIKRGLSLGNKNIYIIDQSSGSYGLDLKENIDFADLLNEIDNIEGDFKVRLYYFEPIRFYQLYHKINKSFLKNRLSYINVPIQTTSQRILKLMNRSYNIEKILDIIKEIKIINNTIFLDTVIMYGFPTETFDEFKNNFDILYLFNNVSFLYYSEKNKKNLKNNSKKELLLKLLYVRKMKLLKANIDENIDELIYVLKYL